MKPILPIALAVVALTVLVDQAAAGKPSFGKEIQNGYRKNVLWPYPDVCPDRRHVRAPFEVMVQNGWRRQNLLGPHHFDAEKGGLTTAGELKVHWVMTQAPEQYRQVFIERSLDPTVTQQRIEAAQNYATQVALEGQTPLVRDTHLISEGRPAAMVDHINVAFRESMLPPALPAAKPGDN